MPAENQLKRLEMLLAGAGRADADAQALGHLVSLNGAQAVVHIPMDALAAADGEADVSIGTYLGVRTRRGLVIGVISEIVIEGTIGAPAARTTSRVDLLGEIAPDPSGTEQFQRGVSHYPTVGSPVVRIGERELRLIFHVAGPGTIDIGTLQQDRSIGAHIDVEEMVQKHFAVFGSTGSGKSSAVAIILREIMAARMDLRILLIDPHNEYGVSFEDKAHLVRPGNLRLPFWLFNFDELVEVIFGRRSDVTDEIGLLSELIPLAKNDYARNRGGDHASYRQIEPNGGRYTVDTPVPYRMEDLIALADSRMGKLENRAAAASYLKLVMRLNTVRRNPRYAFIFEDADGDGDSMVDILCQLLRLEDGGRPMTVVQLAGFPAEVFDAIASVLFRIAFEFGLWTDGAIPLLVVCEEAHQYAHSDLGLGFQPARQALACIAKEGRKYGVFLGLVTQRPAQIDPTLVSQCSTVFAMRMGDEGDQKIVRAAVSDPANRLLGSLPALGTREALAFGAGVPVATRLRFKELPEAFVPRSEAVWGGRMEAGAAVDRNVVAEVVARWRGIAMSNKPAREASTLEQVLIQR
jgi:DNA helicase HerA-like ATPase